GLGAIGNSTNAIKSIYAAKKRPLNNPLIAHAYSKKQAEKYIDFTEIAEVLANKFWPGPLTIIAQTKNNEYSKILSQGKSSLAMRVPSHPVALDLIKRVNVPILAPSANLSGGVSPTLAEHVINDFGPAFKGHGWELSKIINYGSCTVGIESTVLDCRGEKPIILRHGFITAEMISDFVKLDVLDLKNEKTELISPGLLKSHYSPKANVFINQNKSMVNSGWLTFGNTPKSLQKNKNLFNLSPTKNLFQACFLLYSGLRYLDSQGVKNIQVMPIPNEGVGVAINDRLKRASYKN
ncbi:L-threonylcarbamoyladenylate synthase, partial [Alphaproteobacteria bacterium]|nr:L-threonylcarbamoyladenylate synthase [Alphaproteobacteria bacterium]